MPHIIPFIIGGAAVGAGASTLFNQAGEIKAIKKEQAQTTQMQTSAVADLQSAQDTASTQAQAALDAKKRAAASSQDIFTSPLGITSKASTARKTLLGY